MEVKLKSSGNLWEFYSIFLNFEHVQESEAFYVLSRDQAQLRFSMLRTLDLTGMSCVLQMKLSSFLKRKK
jgi:hypothetical protein